MLTVKHVESNGYQSVTLAEMVTFDPAIGQNNEYPNGQVIAWGVKQPISDGCNRYGDGLIYVMNDQGSTVAKYDLG